MPLSPSVSMMNGLQPVPAAAHQRMTALPPRKRPARPMIRPMATIPDRRILDETAISRLPPPPKTSRYVQNGKLKIPVPRPNSADDRYDRRSMSHESSYVSRSPSPAYSQSTQRSGSSLSNYDTWRSSDCSRSRSTPRRQFPQTYTNHSLDVHEFYKMEQAPVVYDANLSFVWGMKKPMHQTLRASPAHSEKSTASSYLSEQINSFLKRTDHVMEEWSAMGRKTDDTVSYIERQRELRSQDRSIGRSRSATNIQVRGFQLTKSQPSFRRSMSRDINEIPSDLIEDDDRTVCDEEVSREWRDKCCCCPKGKFAFVRIRLNTSTIETQNFHFNLDHDFVNKTFLFNMFQIFSDCSGAVWGKCWEQKLIDSINRKVFLF